MKKKLTRRQIMRNLSELQNLIGEAQAAYGNDLDPSRADKVYKALTAAFNLALNTRD